MNIVPISSMSMLQNSPIAQGANNQTEIPFQTMFKQAMQNVEETQAVSRQDAIDLAVGEVDDLGQVMINSQRAEFAVQTMITLRDRVLDAYTEIMRINV